MLTKLFSPAGGRTTTSGGGITISGQRSRERLDPLSRVGGLDRRLVPALKLGDLLPRELGDGPRPGPFGQESQRAGCQIVVGVLEGTAASVGDRKQPGRPAAAPAAVSPDVPDLDHAVSQQVVEMPPD